jgi:hypothetical protein
LPWWQDKSLVFEILIRLRVDQGRSSSHELSGQGRNRLRLAHHLINRHRRANQHDFDPTEFKVEDLSIAVSLVNSLSSHEVA